MENSNQTPNANPEKAPQKVVVLRWGHRPQRDARLTSHVALTARALGASGFILSDVEDKSIQETVEKVNDTWGSSFFFKMGLAWRKTVRDWKRRGNIIVHLTAYGENIQTSDVLKRIRGSNRDLLVVVGSQKVPREFYSTDVSDFNVAVGNQPHSECAAIAIFLDRFFEGKKLGENFENAKMRIVPQKRGKKIV